MSRLPWLLSRTIAVLAIGLGLAASATADEAPPATPQKAVSFETDVRPILEAKCVRCHGPETQKSDLNLSTPHGIRQGSETGPILDEKSPRESKLYEYVHERMMPPEGEGELSDAEISTITRWIEAGAPLGNSREETTSLVTQLDALPILLLRCTICHGRQRQEAGLDIRSVASLLKGGKSGPAIVPGKPDDSLLIKKIRAAEMPPLNVLAHYSVKPVPDDELQTLTRWIAAVRSSRTCPPTWPANSPIRWCRTRIAASGRFRSHGCRPCRR